MMEYKISKELFEAVMGIELYLDKSFEFKLMHDLSEYDLSYNDFFFKCKEWALEQGYHLRSWPSYCACLEIDGIFYVNQEDFQQDSEQQAVFDACQWILEDGRDS